MPTMRMLARRSSALIARDGGPILLPQMHAVRAHFERRVDVVIDDDGDMVWERGGDHLQPDINALGVRAFLRPHLQDVHAARDQIARHLAGIEVLDVRRVDKPIQPAAGKSGFGHQPKKTFATS